MLMGGTPFMFSRDATRDEIEAALDYIELMGLAPVLSDDSIQGMRESAEYNVARGVPNIEPFPIWGDPEVEAARMAIFEEFRNVDQALYADFFRVLRTPGMLRAEEPVSTQDLYAELTNVMQAVLTDRNADVAALLSAANDNFQTLLDQNENQ